MLLTSQYLQRVIRDVKGEGICGQMVLQSLGSFTAGRLGALNTPLYVKSFKGIYISLRPQTPFVNLPHVANSEKSFIHALLGMGWGWAAGVLTPTLLLCVQTYIYF